MQRRWDTVPATLFLCYSYDADGNQSLAITGLGTAAASTTYSAYDANGNQTEQITAYGTPQAATTLSQFDGDGNLTLQVDADGHTSTFAFDALGDQTAAVAGVGTAQAATTKDSYDGDGNLTLQVDAVGNSTSYQYNADGEETLMVQGVGTAAVTSTSYAYDADGNQTLVVSGYGTAAAESTFSAYDANGNQTEQITAYGTASAATTYSFFDGDGNLTEQIDANKNTSTFAFDALGDQTQSIAGVGNANAATTTDSYDGNNNLTLQVDADGHSTSYQYNADGEETLMVQGVGSTAVTTTSYAYDADGNQTLVVTGLGSANPDSTFYAFDANGNQTQSITGYNSAHPETTTSAYDGDGNLTLQVDADGNTSTFAYDALGDQTQSVVGASSTDPGTTTDSYDGDGNLTLSVNAVGDSTSYAYDADGHQTLVVQGYGTASAASVHYLYDASGNQIQEIDPDGNTTSYEYNADGEQTLMIQAYGSSVAATTAYQYDGDGNVTLQTNPNGTSIAGSYDDQGDLTAQTWYASGTVVNNIAYTHDEDGNILTASNDAGSYSYGYNADGEQTQVVAPSGVTLNYQYDAEGNVTQVSDSLGDTVTSQYDANGNLISRGYSGPNGAQLLLTFTYDGDGNLTGINRYSDLAGTQLVGTTTYNYNPQGLVSSIQDTAGNTTLASFAYSYNAAGQLTQEVDNGSTTAYGYDATGQLVSAGSTAYNYDANGNPHASTDTIGPNNELLSDGTWNYSYDLNGNIIGKTGVAGGPDAGLTWTYTYDPANELTSATETNSQNQTLVQANYSYDVFAHLTQSSVSTNGGAPVVTNYTYNGNTLWTTQNATHGLQDFYLGGDQLNQFYAQYDTGNGSSWYLTGHLGTVRATMNNAGQVTDNLGFDSFGNLISQSNPSQQPLLGFQGMMFQMVVGLNYDWERWYNPQTQQWMTQDPLLLQPGPNPHEFVNNAPTNATDPTGQYLFIRVNPDSHLEMFRELGATSVKAQWIEDAGKYVFLYSNPKQIENIINNSKDQNVKDMFSAMMSEKTNIVINSDWTEHGGKSTGVDSHNPAWQYVYENTGLSSHEKSFLNQVMADAKKAYLEIHSRLPDSVSPGQYEVLDAPKVAVLPPRFDAARNARDIARAQPHYSEADVFLQNVYDENLAHDPDRVLAEIRANAILRPSKEEFDKAWQAWVHSGTKLDDYLDLPNKLMETHEFQQGMRVLGGAMETVSGVLMIVNPFVPVASQSLGMILIGHGLDSIQAGGRSLYEGKNVQTYTYKGSSSLAKQLGASNETANSIGVLADNMPGLLDLTHLGAQGVTALARYGMKNSRNLGKVMLFKGKKVDVHVLTLTKAEAEALNTAAKGGRYSLSVFERSCFVAGTLLLTRGGSKEIERFRRGDQVLSRSEHDVDGPLEAKIVEEVFVRVAPVLELVVGGRLIGTTAEHPFYVLGQGWRCAQELQTGDWLLSHERIPIRVEQVRDTGEVATVYNLRVADYHTYFVGAEDWGFSVWAHNAVCGEAIRQASGMTRLTDQQLSTAVELLNQRSTRAAMRELAVQRYACHNLYSVKEL